MGPLTSIGRKDPQPPEHEIARLAARQHGYVTYDQLAAAGLSRTQIDLRVRSGRFIRVFTRVYAVGHAPIYPLNRAAAAVLACGPGACSATPQRSRCGGGARTGPARTLLDMAPRLTEARLNRLYNDARVAHHVRNDELRELVGRVRNARLRRLITDENPTRSDLEDDFLAFVKRYNLPRPHCNVVVAGFEVDFCYPEQRVIVELDSWTFHRDRPSFERDRARDSATTAAGFRTVRVTAQRLTESEAARLAAILGV